MSRWLLRGEWFDTGGLAKTCGSHNEEALEIRGLIKALAHSRDELEQRNLAQQSIGGLRSKLALIRVLESSPRVVSLLTDG